MVKTAVKVDGGGFPLFVLPSDLYPVNWHLRDALRSMPSVWNIFGYDFLPSWLEKSLKDMEIIGKIWWGYRENQTVSWSIQQDANNWITKIEGFSVVK